MRGVDPKTWWRYHRRMETGELWVGPGADARRAQRLVQASSVTVQDLVARRDDDLRCLAAAMWTAAAELRTTTIRLVTAQGLGRVATVLGARPQLVRDLCSEEQPTPMLSRLPPRCWPEPARPRPPDQRVTSPATPP